MQPQGKRTAAREDPRRGRGSALCHRLGGPAQPPPASRSGDQCAAVCAEEEEGDPRAAVHVEEEGDPRSAVRAKEEGGRSAPWPLALLCGGRERGMRGERAEMSAVR
jgi:hypothetical protein